MTENGNTFALSLCGLALLAASVVGVVSITKQEAAIADASALSVADWTGLRRLIGQRLEGGGVTFVVDRVILGGEELNPVRRVQILASGLDLVVFRIVARNLGREAAAITPAAFRLTGVHPPQPVQTYAKGFDDARLGPGEARLYHVGFTAAARTVPCMLTLERQAMMGNRYLEGAAVRDTLDVCPGPP